MFDNFTKAIAKFTKEDPTLRTSSDSVTGDTVLSGMGELHLEIYIERMEREYGVKCEVGTPSVRYREAISGKQEFNFLHKKQSGGSGQFARVIGYVESISDEELEEAKAKGKSNEDDDTIGFEFVNNLVGTNIPQEFIPSCENGAKEAMRRGMLIDAPVQGVRVVLEDGQSHPVDSSDQAFRTAMSSGAREAMRKAGAQILEPIMTVEITVPTEFQGNVITGITQRRGMLSASEPSDDGSATIIKADVALSGMFGYASDLRSSTQGMGEFSMEYSHHAPVTRDDQEKLIKEHLEAKKALEG